MITFILNNKKISTSEPAGMPLVDFIRYQQDLTGTKIGCREGDCGACTVLQGTLADGQVKYESIMSCLTPLGNVAGKHIVTIEGINMNQLSPVQDAIVNQTATQCGFCTPGFVMAFTGFSMSPQKASTELAIASVSGNICRCTGYKSIERAAADISKIMRDKNTTDPIKWLVEQKYLPEYFVKIPERLAELNAENPDTENAQINMGGGTDLMVQQHDKIYASSLNLLRQNPKLKQIFEKNGRIYLGAMLTATELQQSPILQAHIPRLQSAFKLISSEAIRNMGTLAGNIVNASPIGDLSIIFLALQAQVHLRKGNTSRQIPLHEFFIDYKMLDLRDGEIIEFISIAKSDAGMSFNFEKISKRIHLDIASVNTALSIELKDDQIVRCNVAAGGVKAVPLFLKQTSAFLTNKPLDIKTLKRAVDIIQNEISPISDVRGTSDYKRLLLQQLFYAHFIQLFPEQINERELLT